MSCEQARNIFPPGFVLEGIVGKSKTRIFTPSLLIGAMASSMKLPILDEKNQKKGDFPRPLCYSRTYKTLTFKKGKSPMAIILQAHLFSWENVKAQRFRTLGCKLSVSQVFDVVYGNWGALSKFSLAISVKIRTILGQQDTPRHSFQRKIRI